MSFLKKCEGGPSRNSWVAIFLLVTMLFSVGSLAGCSADTEDSTTSAIVSQAAGETSNLTETSPKTSAVLDPESTESSGEADGQTVESEQPSTASTTEAPATTTAPASTPATGTTAFDLSSVPAYSGTPYATVNNNTPYFTDAEIAAAATSYEYYSPLDSLGRCGVTVASIGKDLMPTEERGSIGMVKPTGWHTVKYDCVDGKYLYNRCHLIGYQLSGENANTSNLITGTRYMNVDGQLPFENMVADYVKETSNHVLYRVTPIFEGNNLVATGVLMEAMSIEDAGAGILFNVFCYNVQPGVGIDYATGDSWLEDSSGGTNEATTPAVTQPETTQPATQQPTETSQPTATSADYILNTNTKKFHYPSCSSVGQMSDKNKKEYTGSRDDLISQGYSPCGRCNP
jgi:DNA-entry nuclease